MKNKCENIIQKLFFVIGVFLSGCNNPSHSSKSAFKVSDGIIQWGKLLHVNSSKNKEIAQRENLKDGFYYVTGVTTNKSGTERFLTLDYRTSKSNDIQYTIKIENDDEIQLSTILPDYLRKELYNVGEKVIYNASDSSSQINTKIGTIYAFEMVYGKILYTITDKNKLVQRDSNSLVKKRIWDYISNNFTDTFEVGDRTNKGIIINIIESTDNLPSVCLLEDNKGKNQIRAFTSILSKLPPENYSKIGGLTLKEVMLRRDLGWNLSEFIQRSRESFQNVFMTNNYAVSQGTLLWGSIIDMKNLSNQFFIDADDIDTVNTSFIIREVAYDTTINNDPGVLMLRLSNEQNMFYKIRLSLSDQLCTLATQDVDTRLKLYSFYEKIEYSLDKKNWQSGIIMGFSEKKFSSLTNPQLIYSVKDSTDNTIFKLSQEFIRKKKYIYQNKTFSVGSVVESYRGPGFIINELDRENTIMPKRFSIVNYEGMPVTDISSSELGINNLIDYNPVLKNRDLCNNKTFFLGKAKIEDCLLTFNKIFYTESSPENRKIAQKYQILSGEYRVANTCCYIGNDRIPYVTLFLNRNTFNENKLYAVDLKYTDSLSLYSKSYDMTQKLNNYGVLERVYYRIQNKWEEGVVLGFQDISTQNVVYKIYDPQKNKIFELGLGDINKKYICGFCVGSLTDMGYITSFNNCGDEIKCLTLDKHGNSLGYWNINHLTPIQDPYQITSDLKYFYRKINPIEILKIRRLVGDIVPEKFFLNSNYIRIIRELLEERTNIDVLIADNNIDHKLKIIDDSFRLITDRITQLNDMTVRLFEDVRKKIKNPSLKLINENMPLLKETLILGAENSEEILVPIVDFEIDFDLDEKKYTQLGKNKFHSNLRDEFLNHDFSEDNVLDIDCSNQHCYITEDKIKSIKISLLEEEDDSLFDSVSNSTEEKIFIMKGVSIRDTTRKYDFQTYFYSPLMTLKEWNTHFDIVLIQEIYSLSENKKFRSTNYGRYIVDRMVNILLVHMKRCVDLCTKTFHHKLLMEYRWLNKYVTSTNNGENLLYQGRFIFFEKYMTTYNRLNEEFKDIIERTKNISSSIIRYWILEERVCNWPNHLSSYASKYVDYL